MYRFARSYNKPWEKLTLLWNLENNSNCSFGSTLIKVNEVIRNSTQKSLRRHNFKWHVKHFDHIICFRQLHTSTASYVRHAKLIEDVETQKNERSEATKKRKGLDTDSLHDTKLKDEFKCNDPYDSKYIFEHPKNVLNSFYAILSQELGTKFNVSVTFAKNHNEWLCTYHLKWPETLKISKRAYNKRDASHKAAIAVLEWLQNCGKIISDGKPIIYDATEMKNMFKKMNRKVLILSDSNISKLNSIYEKYRKNFFNYLEINSENNIEERTTADFTKLDNPWPLHYTRQRILNTKNYLMKETVHLPIQEYKDEIIELIRKNGIVIIKGETGCGKSIRVPQYVLEGWAKSGAINEEQCKIIVTQPRRIAAISLAEQVAYERNEEVGRLVGYQVRFKTNFNSNMSRILYCTTGILLRRLQTDPELKDCTHIILDEAHERDVNTDLMMNLLQYAMKMNPALKLIVMSATIDTDIFKEYFKDAAIFNIPGRTFPVKEHYIDSNKIINYEKTLKMCQSDEPYVVAEDVVNTIQYIHRTKPEGAILCFLPSWEDIARITRMLPSSADMNVLCLHSKLDISDQKRVFENPPTGVRKVILSTNIAETSVTINDIVYVIDTGIQKLSKFDAEKGIMCVDQEWISQANMQQRRGRAGRLQPGESYHLYTKKQLNNFIKYPIPEILRTSLTKIVLDSKVYSNNMNAIEFLSQLPTPPSEKVISQAVNELIELDLLDENENTTPLGKTLSNFQMEPKLAKAIADGVIFRCCTPIIDIAALFSEETNIFHSVLRNQDDIKEIKRQFSTTSDHLAMVKIFEKWLEYTENGDRSMASEFCSENSLTNYKLYTLQRLRDVYFDYVYNGFNKEILISDEMSDHDELVKAVLSADAGSILTLHNFEKVKGRLKKKKTFLTRNRHKVNISSESVNCKQTGFPTDFMVYINETRSNIRRTTTVRETSFISLLSLLLFKNEELLCREIKPSEYSDELDSNDQVVLALKNARIECVCDRSHADAIMKCKEAIRAAIVYYSSQLTCTTKPNPELEQEWGRMLQILSSILSSSNS